MRIPNHHDIERHNDAAMTPMIDVVFLLLIFLLCASTGQIQESLLPTDLAAGAIKSDQIDAPPKPFGEVWLYLRTGPGGRSEVQVNQGGEIYADFNQLERQLKTIGRSDDGNSRHPRHRAEGSAGDMIRVYDASRAAGFDSINFAIDRPETKNASEIGFAAGQTPRATCQRASHVRMRSNEGKTVAQTNGTAVQSNGSQSCTFYLRQPLGSTPMAAAEPNNALGFYRRGVSLRKEGSTRVPSGISVKRFGCFPEDGDAFRERGNARFAIGDCGSAIADLNQAVQFDSTEFRNYISRGRVLDEMDECDKAISDFKEALRLRPNNVRARYNWSRVLVSQNDLEPALKLLKTSRAQPSHGERTDAGSGTRMDFRTAFSY